LHTPWNTGDFPLSRNFSRRGAPFVLRAYPRTFFHHKTNFCRFSGVFSAFAVAKKGPNINETLTKVTQAWDDPEGFLYGCCAVLVGESCSAFRTSSVQYFSAVGGLHSLSEAVLFKSLALLGLIGSKHFRYLLQT
jgi:hypothetical protein